MRKFLFLTLIFLISLNVANANIKKSIKLAIFDNPQSDPSRVENENPYLNAYISGINT